MIGEIYSGTPILFIGLRKNTSPRNFQLIKLDYLSASPISPVWAKTSQDNTDILGIIYGKDKTEIFVVAYDRSVSKTVLTKINDAGTIFWTYQCDLVYTEAPMLVDSKLNGSFSFIILTTKLPTGAYGITKIAQ